MRQLLPDPVDPVDLIDVYGSPPVGAGRPGVRVNMIASLDGATAVDGRSGGLGGPADQRVLRVLRAVTDVVLVGAGTVRAEGYGPVRLAPELAAVRAERGAPPLPTLAVVSRSCDLDWGSPLFTEAAGATVVVTVADAPASRRSRAAEVADVLLAGRDEVDLAHALAELAERGAHRVLAEGGPTLNAHLAAAGLLDELCLTVSPRVVGGAATRVLAGDALVPHPRFVPASVCTEDGFLFLRMRRTP